MAQRYKKKCRREEIYDDFLFEGISATGKKKNWRNVSVPPVSYPYSISAMVVNFFHTSAWRYASTHPFGTYSLQVVKVESVKPPS